MILRVRHQVLRTGRRDRRHIRDRVHRFRPEIQDRIADDIVGFGQLRQRYNRPAGTNDAGFFACDFANRIAKIFLMIERDVGDDAYARVDNVGGVQAAAHADFEHGEIYALIRKMDEGDCGHHFEEAGVPRKFRALHQTFGNSINFAVKRGEIIVADFFAVHADPFVDSNQVR
jgi:hypothetical protein